VAEHEADNVVGLTSTEPTSDTSGNYTMKILRESWIIACIGIADLVTTLIWVHHHGAQEANPLFAHYLAMGSVWFAVMKLVLLAGPIFLLEWASRHRPLFTRRASQFAICAYLVLYGVGVAKLNPNLLRPEAAHAEVVVAAAPGSTVSERPSGYNDWLQSQRRKKRDDRDFEMISSAN
jgi:hypothetical protein